MDFGCFQSLTGDSALQSNFCIQQWGLDPDFHSIDHNIEAITAGNTSVQVDTLPLENITQSIHMMSGSSPMISSGDLYTLGLQQEASNNASFMNNYTSMVHNIGSLMPSLAPIEVPHLTESSSNDASVLVQLSSNDISRKKAAHKNPLKKADIVKGRWTQEEDRKLIILVEQFGLENWTQIGRLLPGREGKQCKERWHNNLKPNIKKGPWTEQEEMILVQVHKELGNKWKKITKRIPGRTETSVKNHWNATKQKIFRRKWRCSTSKNPNSRNILQNYVESLGLGPSKKITPPAPQEIVLPLYSSLQVPWSQAQDWNFEPDMASIQAPQEIFDWHDDTNCNNHPHEELSFLACDDFSLDMFDNLFDTKEPQYQGYYVDDDATRNDCMNEPLSYLDTIAAKEDQNYA